MEINREKESLITQAYLKSLFDYQDGQLIWKVTNSNRIRIGQIAGTLNKDGYIHIIIDGIVYKAHRLIWLYHYGKWPEKLIDHVNRNKSDNRIENLREVSQQENQRHTKIQSNNTSGHCGVSWNKPLGKWRAQIMTNNKQIHLGLFNNIEDAVKARKEAEKEHNFSIYHGNTAPLPNVVNI